MRPGNAWASRVTVRLKDGREAARAVDDFKGSPSRPMSREELQGKFRLLAADLGADETNRLLGGLEDLESQEDVSRLFA
jgi:2-methylcitrate dehydratase PrpD